MEVIKLIQELGVTLACVTGFFMMIIWNVKQNNKREHEYRQLFEKHDKLLEELVKISTSMDSRLTVIEEQIKLIRPKT